ncbi:MAG: hypothetical protein NTY01_05755 [Verrucomicrobia bacterium]|nr:hypothetical protein [Verrucomicrobiota bacterium]
MKSNHVLSTVLSMLLAAGAAFAADTAADNTKASRLMFPRIEFHQATLDDVVAFFCQQSRKLDPDKSGVTIILVPSDKTKSAKVDLSLVNASLAKAVKYVALRAGLEIKRDGEDIILHAAGTACVLDTAADNTKASKLIFPSIELRQASLVDVIAFFCQRSRQLDPAKTGVTIILAPSDKTKSAKIDLSLVNVSLSKALKYLAITAGLEMTRDGEDIILKSK